MKVVHRAVIFLLLVPGILCAFDPDDTKEDTMPGPSEGRLANILPPLSNSSLLSSLLIPPGKTFARFKNDTKRLKTKGPKLNV
jgi:hypothetical protein